MFINYLEEDILPFFIIFLYNILRMIGDNMKNIKVISLTTCVSIFLLTLALLTINKTFSFEKNDSRWDVHFETDNEFVIIDDTRIDFYNTLKVGENYTLYVDVVNDGDYDSQIYKVLKSNLKDYSLEDSTYTYDDFLTYSVLYEDSLEKVNTFDSLSQKSKKRIRVDVRYDISKLDEKKYEYLRSHDNKLNFSLYLQLNYKQM